MAKEKDKKKKKKVKVGKVIQKVAIWLMLIVMVASLFTYAFSVLLSK